MADEEVVTGAESVSVATSDDSGSSVAATEVSKPKSAREAVERVHAKAEVPTGDSPASDQGDTGVKVKAGAAGTETQPVTPKKYSTPPKENWEQILNNAREKAVAEVKSKLGWAEGFTKEQVDYAMGVARRLQTPAEARAFNAQLARELKALGEDPDEIVDPEPDLQSEDGKLRAFSDQKMKQLLQNQEKRLTALFRKEMQPVSEFTRTEQARRGEEVARQQIDTAAKEAVDEFLKLPHAKENQAAISQEIGKMDPAYVNRVGHVAALHVAYSRVMNEVVLPGFSKKAEDKVRESFRRDANASVGSVQPGQGAAKGKTKVKLGDVGGLAERIKQMSEQANRG